MLTGHAAFRWLDESDVDPVVVGTAVFLKHGGRAVTHRSKNIANLLSKVRESFEFRNLRVYVRKKQ